MYPSRWQPGLVARSLRLDHFITEPVWVTPTSAGHARWIPGLSMPARSVCVSTTPVVVVGAALRRGVRPAAPCPSRLTFSPILAARRPRDLVWCSRLSVKTQQILESAPEKPGILTPLHIPTPPPLSTQTVTAPHANANTVLTERVHCDPCLRSPEHGSPTRLFLCTSLPRTYLARPAPPPHPPPQSSPRP